MTTLNLSEKDTAYQTSIGFVYAPGTGQVCDATTEYMGARWSSGVSIPSDATITSCVFSIVPDSSTKDEPLHDFYFVEQAAPAAWTTGGGSYDLRDRPKTTATVRWDNTNLGYSSGETYYSPGDMSALLQEVVDSQGALTAVALICHGNSSLRDLAFGNYNAKLDITWPGGDAPKTSRLALLGVN